MLVGGKLGPVPSVGHAIFEFRRGAPNSPPQSVGFEQIAQRVIGLLFLDPLRVRDGRIQIEGVDLFDGLGSSWRQGQLLRARLGGEKGCRECRREEKYRSPSKGAE